MECRKCIFFEYGAKGIKCPILAAMYKTWEDTANSLDVHFEWAISDCDKYFLIKKGK